MTETAKEIFDKYEVRKTKKQKTDFIDYVRNVSEREGYSFEVERGRFGARNIVVGDVKSAKVVFSAHYDTCPVLPMPNFITPKCIPLYILYQLLLTAVVFVPVWIVSLAYGVLCVALSTFAPQAAEIATQLIPVVVYLAMVCVLILILSGPANKHTANDNTSGVTTILNIMTDLPKELRDKVAFVLFDLEEVGLVGSSSFAKQHKEEMRGRLLVNFDCVSDGDNFIFALRRGAVKYEKLIEDAYASDVFQVEVLSRGVFYPSDQVCFECGVGAAALKRTKKLGILYMDRIHTRRDNIYNEENIAYLVSRSLRLAELLK